MPLTLFILYDKEDSEQRSCVIFLQINTNNTSLTTETFPSVTGPPALQSISVLYANACAHACSHTHQLSVCPLLAPQVKFFYSLPFIYILPLVTPTSPCFSWGHRSPQGLTHTHSCCWYTHATDPAFLCSHPLHSCCCFYYGINTKRFCAHGPTQHHIILWLRWRTGAWTRALTEPIGLPVLFIKRYMSLFTWMTLSLFLL